MVGYSETGSTILNDVQEYPQPEEWQRSEG
jgi:hypothetical protein